jgi:hypothetical protein
MRPQRAVIHARMPPKTLELKQGRYTDGVMAFVRTEPSKASSDHPAALECEDLNDS